MSVTLLAMPVLTVLVKAFSSWFEARRATAIVLHLGNGESLCIGSESTPDEIARQIERGR